MRFFLSARSGDQGARVRVGHPREQGGGAHGGRRHTQTGRSVSPTPQTQAEKVKRYDGKKVFVSVRSGGSEAQRLLLDEQFLQRDSESERKSHADTLQAGSCGVSLSACQLGGATRQPRSTISLIFLQKCSGHF